MVSVAVAVVALLLFTAAGLFGLRLMRFGDSTLIPVVWITVVSFANAAFRMFTLTYRVTGTDAPLWTDTVAAGMRVSVASAMFVTLGARYVETRERRRVR